MKAVEYLDGDHRNLVFANGRMLTLGPDDPPTDVLEKQLGWEVTLLRPKADGRWPLGDVAGWDDSDAA